MNNPVSKYRTPAVCIGLVLTIFIAYEPMRQSEFIDFDDYEYVIDNQNVTNGISCQSFSWALTAKHSSNWHPLTWLSHMMDCLLFGLSAPWHHLTSLLIHTANTLLLFVVFRRMTNMFWRSAFIAAAFALHPLHVESVAWVSERKDVLSTLFWILTMYAYLGYVKRPGAGRYLLTVLAFAFGLMAKPMLVTLPFVLLLLDYWPLGRLQPAENINNTKRTQRNNPSQWRIFCHLAWEKAPFFALSAASCIVTFLVQQAGGAVHKAPFIYRLGNAFLSYAKYILKTAWPSRLAIYYPHPQQQLSIWQTAVSALLIVSVTLWSLRYCRRKGWLTMGWLWYLGTLIPVIGLVQAGTQAMADRYTYIPSIGLFIIIAWAIPELLARWRYKKILLALATAAAVLAMMISTHRYVSYWQNSKKLFTHALTVTGDNPGVHCMLAQAMFRQNKPDEAAYYYKQAIRIEPNWDKPINNLAWILATSKRTKPSNRAEAIHLAERACKLTNYQDPGTLDTLAVAYAAMGRFTEAVDTGQKAIDIARSAAQNELAEQIKARVQLYKADRPYHEPTPPASQ